MEVYLVWHGYIDEPELPEVADVPAVCSTLALAEVAVERLIEANREDDQSEVSRIKDDLDIPSPQRGILDGYQQWWIEERQVDK
jgi:hypothetical protein